MLKIIENVSYNEVVDLILEEKVGAIHQGQSECGPRALGNRSILFDPRVPNGKDIVNVIKKRESFRPFAATILEEHCSDWFDMLGLHSSPFMTFSLNIKEGKRDYVPSIIHVDGTCRIQTINKEQNYHYYNLINCFYQKTNIPMLLNTSFNLAGDPIVETVSDSIKTLCDSELRYLYFPEISTIILK